MYIRLKNIVRRSYLKRLLTPLIMRTASFDTDLGYETLCSKMELNNSSSSSPSKGGCETQQKNKSCHCRHCYSIGRERGAGSPSLILAIQTRWSRIFHPLPFVTIFLVASVRRGMPVFWFMHSTFVLGKPTFLFFLQ